MRKFFLVFSILLTVLAAHAAQPGQPNTEIWYTATKKIDLRNNVPFGTVKFDSIHSTWNGTNGVLKFTGNVTTIPKEAFKDSVQLLTISLPNTVTTIGDGAFQNDNQLQTISWSDVLTSIGFDAFRGCTVLVFDALPNSLEKIGTEAFKNCKGLVSVAFGPNMKTLGVTKESFMGCTNLRTVDLSQTQLTTLVSGTFKDCSSLETVLLPPTLEEISGNVFGSCISLSSVVFPSTSALRTIGASFGNCTSLVSINFPSSLESIAGMAFSGCTNLGDIVIPGSVTSIGGSAFPCFSSVTIEEGLETLSIGAHAFRRTSKGGYVDIRRTSVVLTGGPFDNVSRIFVPCGQESMYAAVVASTEFVDPCQSLSDQEDPTAKLNKMKTNSSTYGTEYTLTFAGRTLWHDGYYNTISLPFSMSAAEIAASPLAGYSSLKEFVSAEVTAPNTAEETLEITLADVSSIEAGKPYFISWPVGADVFEPTFPATRVTTSTPQTVGTGDVVCKATLAPSAFTANTYSKLFLGEENLLYWANVSENMPGFRAYLELVGGAGSPVRVGMRARIVESTEAGEIATSIEQSSVKTIETTKTIRNGQLIILRDGHQYSAQGLIIQ